MISYDSLYKAFLQSLSEIGLSGENLSPLKFFENPFNSTEGQISTSVAENLWSRIAREGRQLKTSSLYSNIPGGSETTKNLTTPVSAGCVFFPYFVTISSDQNALLKVELSSNIKDALEFSLFQYKAAYNPLQHYFAGGEYILYGGGVNFKITPAATANLVLSIYGWEVPQNVL